MSAWRFQDQSHVVLLPARTYPGSIEVLCAHGVNANVMRDTSTAVRTVLRGIDIPRMETLARAYVAAHGGLPALDHDSLRAALRARSRAIRLAAIASLGSLER